MAAVFHILLKLKFRHLGYFVSPVLYEADNNLVDEWEG